MRPRGQGQGLDLRGQGQGLQNLSSRPRTSSRTPPLIMGQHPCGYALLGMGSLARNEITPYSDFEHIITLENYNVTAEELDQCKEYFRWYSTIFHIIVINLQETDLYSVCVPCLNDHTKESGNWFYDRFTHPGISFDGMMPHACHFPLGKTQETPELPWRTELIQTIDDMVKYLKVKSIKEGYKLGNLLTKTCFVAGDEKIFWRFSKKVEEVFKKNSEERHLNVVEQLQEDLNKFHSIPSIFDFSSNDQMNIKRYIYRCVTLYVSAMGSLLDASSSGSFEILEELQSNHKISDYAVLRITQAVAVACHIRLSLCIDVGTREEDTIVGTGQMGRVKLNRLLRVVNRDSLVKCLATSFSLQQVMQNCLHVGSFFSIGAYLDMYLRDFDSWIFMKMLNLLDFQDEVLRKGKEFMDSLLSFSEDELTQYCRFRDSKIIEPRFCHEIPICEVFRQLCYGYTETHCYRECLDVCKRYKRIGLHMPTQRFNHEVSINEFYCLTFYCKYQAVINGTERMLKQDLSSDQYVRVTLANGMSKFRSEDFRGALISMRDSRRIARQDQFGEKFNIGLYSFEIISSSLLQLGRIEPGLHSAREFFNYTQMVEMPIHFQARFIRLIKLQNRDIKYFQYNRPAPLALSYRFGLIESIEHIVLIREEGGLAALNRIMEKRLELDSLLGIEYLSNMMNEFDYETFDKMFLQLLQ